MKRIVSFLMICGLVLALAGCGNTADDNLSSSVPSSVSIDDPKKGTIYEGHEWDEYICDTKSENEAVKKLNDIHTTQIGVAGYGFQVACDGVAFIELSLVDDSDLKQLKLYLDSLNELQLDFLSYQLNNAYEAAVSIVNRNENIINTLAEIKVFEDSYKNGSLDKVEAFMQKMKTLLEEKGVQYQWKQAGI